MHAKEIAISPWVKDILGGRLIVPAGLDTDQFGTFSGDVTRDGTMGEIAVRKAEMGMRLSGLDLGIASEGTYGSHPFLPFVPGGMELLVFIDQTRNLKVFESMVDDAPCFDHIHVSNIDELSGFLKRVGFPDQGLVVSAGRLPDPSSPIVKGITTKHRLAEAITSVQDAHGSARVLVQTDMRANYNPSRMKTLAKLAEKLCSRLATPCPNCDQPGFGRAIPASGLPCAECGSLTSLSNGHHITCDACTYSEHVERADRLQKADPRYCPECNP